MVLKVWLRSMPKNFNSRPYCPWLYKQRNTVYGRSKKQNKKSPQKCYHEDFYHCHVKGKTQQGNKICEKAINELAGNSNLMNYICCDTKIHVLTPYPY